MKNSAASPHSEKKPLFEAASVCFFLCLLITIAAAWLYSRGYLLYYGDAQAHLNLSRGIIDSRTPGYDQLGTVWLPLLHIICLPFVWNDALWSTGLAGTIPVAFCFVIAGVCFYFAAKLAYGSSLAAAVTTCCFALNPNILYLASIPMTELVFTAGLAALLLAMLQFRAHQRNAFLVAGLIASWMMSLTRYDGWFLIPFAAIWFASLAKQRSWQVLIVFGLMASLPLLYWAAHCWWETGNAFDFYNGPYSPKAIQKGNSYPGYRDWRVAFLYYAKAGQLCSGWGLILLGMVGVCCALAKNVFSSLSFLCLPPLFYVLSIHSSGGSPIYLPGGWPYPDSYYNSRYGIAVAVLAAFASGAILLVIPRKWRRLGMVIPLFAVVPWLAHPTEENWICWKESQVNSNLRRTWTARGASLLASIYQSDQGVLTSSGDVVGIFGRAMIPLSETVNIGNGPTWLAGISRPDLAHQAAWAVAQAGDSLSVALQNRNPSAYELVSEIEVKGAPTLEFYRRKVETSK